MWGFRDDQQRDNWMFNSLANFYTTRPWSRRLKLVRCATTTDRHSPPPAALVPSCPVFALLTTNLSGNLSELVRRSTSVSCDDWSDHIVAIQKECARWFFVSWSGCTSCFFPHYTVSFKRKELLSLWSFCMCHTLQCACGLHVYGLPVCRSFCSPVHQKISFFQGLFEVKSLHLHKLPVYNFLTFLSPAQKFLPKRREIS